jgi:predicted  nucleic acid-binding Zn-ribbon protein
VAAHVWHVAKNHTTASNANVIVVPKTVRADGVDYRLAPWYYVFVHTHATPTLAALREFIAYMQQEQRHYKPACFRLILPNLPAPQEPLRVDRHHCCIVPPRVGAIVPWPQYLGLVVSSEIAAGGFNMNNTALMEQYARPTLAARTPASTHGGGALQALDIVAHNSEVAGHTLVCYRREVALQETAQLREQREAAERALVEERDLYSSVMQQLSAATAKTDEVKQRLDVKEKALRAVDDRNAAAFEELREQLSARGVLVGSYDPDDGDRHQQLLALERKCKRKRDELQRSVDAQEREGGALKAKLTETRYLKMDLQQQLARMKQEVSQLEACTGPAYERLEAARRAARDEVDARLEEEENAADSDSE